MRSSVKWNLVVLAVAVGLACATGAYADSITWTISGPSISGSGTLTIAPDCSLGSGTCLILSFNGSLNEGAGPLTFSGAPVSASQSGNYGFNWDNLFFPAENSGGAYLDNGGVLFYVPALNAYVNLWGNGTGGATYSLYSWSPATGNYVLTDSGNIDFEVTGTLVPEPSVLSLLTLGLLG